MILRRIEGSRYSEILPLWKGRTVVAIAFGPSLTQEQVEAVRQSGVPCVAVNDAYLWASFADVSYAADAKWHRWHTAGIAKPALGLTAPEVAARWADFRGQKCSIEWSGSDVGESVHLLRNRDSDVHGMGLSRDPRMLATGRNSGAQVVNMIALAGAKRIPLLGFDGGPDKSGQTHGHGGHPSPTNPEIWRYVRQSFSAMENDLLEMGVRVINCSPGSRIDSFPKMTIDEALEMECEAT